MMEENADSAAPPAPQELTAAGGDNGSFDDEHDEDMLPEEEQVEDTEEQPKAAATAAATASLSSEMSNTELQQWMAGYRDQAGNTIFLAGSARLEHVTIKSFFRDCSNDNAWKDITMLVFDGDSATSPTSRVWNAYNFRRLP